MRYAFTNGVIYTAEKVLYQHALIVNNGLIEAVVKQDELEASIEQIDLQGKNLTAGFIDLQLNGAGGVMFNLETTVETLHTMQQTNMRYGLQLTTPIHNHLRHEYDYHLSVQTLRKYVSALALEYQDHHLRRRHRLYHPHEHHH